MGTISEQIIETLNSLLTKIDEDHQGILDEIAICKEHIEKIQKINIQLDKLEEKIDYIQSFPKEKEEKLTKLVK
jgi:hemerythrin-like domain-containing protein